jgi:tRNA (guanine37-N1)-methyltransferase
MRIDVLTMFPEMFVGPLTESIIKRAIEKRIVEIHVHDLKTYTSDKHKKCDDYPYGGGEGMVLKVEPFWRGVNEIVPKGKRKKKSEARVILTSARGKLFTQEDVMRLSKYKHLVILCGHYEGVDERVCRFVDEEISIGDYVTSGGELPAMVIIDTVVRVLPNVVGNPRSVYNESFTSKFLDYPQYTRPRVFKAWRVPEILLSGDHKKISYWRLKEAIRATYKYRPERLKNINLTEDEKKILSEVIEEEKRN